MKQLACIAIIMMIIGFSGCVGTKIYLGGEGKKDLSDDTPMSRAIDPTSVPAGGTWGTIRGILNTNFSNINGTLDSVEVTLAEYGDSITNYSADIQLRLLKSDTASMLGNYTRNGELNSALAAKVDVSDTAAMLAPYALTSELGEFGSGTGDVIGVDTVAATRVALWSGQDSLTGDARFTYVSSGNGNLTHTGYTTNLSSTIINFGTSTSGTGVIRGAATNGPAIINRTPTATMPNIAIHKSWTTTGIGGTYGSGTSSIAVIVSGATKFQSFDTYNNSFVPLYTPASTSSLAGFRLPHGTAPSTPTNGDLWTTTGGIFTQINGSTDTLATQEYARQYGGTGTVTLSDVQNEIADSLNARIGAGVELSDVAVMIADSTGNAPGNYVTRKALIDSIAAAGTGTGVSITDVRNEIADSLNAIRDNSIPGLAAADTANLVATHYYVSQHSGSSWDSTYVHYRIDSLVTVIDGLNTEIENLWNAVALLGNLDINAPGFESAEIGTYADDTLLVLFDATDIQQDSVPPASAFTLWDGATEHGIASVDINVDSLFLVLDSAAIYGSTYTLDYTRGTPALQDSSGNKTSSWTARSVTNNMEEPAASGLLSGLTAYWDLQESSLPIVDEVASLTSTGTVGSTAIELSMAGRISNSMEFNYLPTYGGGQRIIVGDDLLQHGTISVSLWFYLTSTDEDAFCMIHNTNPGSQNRGFYFFTGGVGGGVAVRAYNSSGSYVEADTDPGYTTAAANTWYHAVFVADGTNLTVYVNGVQRAQEAFPYSISYGDDATLIIGGRDSANGWTMNGRLDEIGFWNRALTTDEITALYNGGSGLAYSSFGD